jgi:hypothetical protein
MTRAFWQRYALDNPAALCRCGCSAVVHKFWGGGELVLTSAPGGCNEFHPRYRYDAIEGKWRPVFSRSERVVERLKHDAKRHRVEKVWYTKAALVDKRW